MGATVGVAVGAGVAVGVRVKVGVGVCVGTGVLVLEGVGDAAAAVWPANVAASSSLLGPQAAKIAARQIRTNSQGYLDTQFGFI